MITAEKIKIKEEVVTVVEKEVVKLTLSVEAAEALHDVCCAIGGCPDTSSRRFFDEIGAALKANGVRRIQGKSRIDGSFFFFSK